MSVFLLHFFEKERKDKVLMSLLSLHDMTIKQNLVKRLSVFHHYVVCFKRERNQKRTITTVTYNETKVEEQQTCILSNDQ